MLLCSHQCGTAWLGVELWVNQYKWFEQKWTWQYSVWHTRHHPIGCKVAEFVYYNMNHIWLQLKGSQHRTINNIHRIWWKLKAGLETRQRSGIVPTMITWNWWFGANNKFKTWQSNSFAWCHIFQLPILHKIVWLCIWCATGCSLVQRSFLE